MSGEDAGNEFDPRFKYAYDPLGRMTFNSRFTNPAYSDYTLEFEYSANPSSDRPAHDTSLRRQLRRTRGVRRTDLLRARSQRLDRKAEPPGECVLGTSACRQRRLRNELIRFS